MAMARHCRHYLASLFAGTIHHTANNPQPRYRAPKYHESTSVHSALLADHHYFFERELAVLGTQHSSLGKLHRSPPQLRLPLTTSSKSLLRSKGPQSATYHITIRSSSAIATFRGVAEYSFFGAAGDGTRLWRFLRVS
jgi:hypothetical protein